MKIGYDLNDLRQASVGAMTGILGLILFFVFGEAKSGMVLHPAVGFLFTMIFLILIYMSINKMLKGSALAHLVIDYAISLTLSVLFAFIFGMIEWSQILTFDFFGTVPIIVSWIVFIPAVVFDIKDLGGFIERYAYFGNGGGSKTSNPNTDIAINYYCTSKYKGDLIDKCKKGEI